MYFVLFIVFTCLSTCHCFIEKDESHCGLLKRCLESSLVSVEITKKGFHREVVTTVELGPGVLGPGVLSRVRVLLVHRWPRGVYLDPYQLASSSEQRDWQILIDSAVDLEVPAHQTAGFVSYVFLALAGPRRSVTLPFHGRYHEPSPGGDAFTSVQMEPPELLLRTQQCSQPDGVAPHAVVDAPALMTTRARVRGLDSSVRWLHSNERGPVGVQIPVGDGSLVTPVCGGTLLVTALCCAALTRHVWKHRVI